MDLWQEHLEIVARIGRADKRLQKEMIFELSLRIQSGNFGEKQVKARRTVWTPGSSRSKGPLCLGNRNETVMKQMVTLQLIDDTDSHVLRHTHVEKLHRKCVW